ncbi:MAG: DedA family protein [Dehalococcoidia bacterium]
MPLPGSLFLLALGSFVAQGEMELWRVLLLASGAAIIGDQIGYAIGRWGGRRAVDALVRRTGRATAMRRAEAFSARWGAPGIFFSRWLITALGPWVNLTSGLSGYPWLKFLFWDLVGEAVWVAAYVTLGRIFADRVQDLSDLLGSIGWLLLALVIAVASGAELAYQFRRAARRARARSG